MENHFLPCLRARGLPRHPAGHPSQAGQTVEGKGPHLKEKLIRVLKLQLLRIVKNADLSTFWLILWTLCQDVCNFWLSFLQLFQWVAAPPQKAILVDSKYNNCLLGELGLSSLCSRSHCWVHIRVSDVDWRQLDQLWGPDRLHTSYHGQLFLDHFTNQRRSQWGSFTLFFPSRWRMVQCRGCPPGWGGRVRLQREHQRSG